MARIALIRIADNVVSNVIEAAEDWTAPTGYAARLLQTNEACGPGYSFNGSTFEPPADRQPPNDVEELTDKVVSLALVVLEAINELRGFDRDLKAVFAANSTLANIRSGVAALPNMPDRTRRQLLDAVRGKLSDGSVTG